MSVFISKQLTVPSLGKALSDYAVGESVFLNVNGAKKEFLVVQQGLPSSVYDTSCNGTWLLMKDCYEQRQWDSTNNDYANSDIHAWLNGSFLDLFDTGIKDAIKQAKIPYRAGAGTSITVSSGSNGLPAKVFLLSYAETNCSAGSSYAVPIGTALDYFEGATDSDRICYLNGSATIWWLRSPDVSYSNVYAMRIIYSGTSNGSKVTDSLGIRPCIIIPSDTKFDPDTNEVKA